LTLSEGPYPSQWVKEITVGGQIISNIYCDRGKQDTPEKHMRRESILKPLISPDSSVIITFFTPSESTDPSETPADVLGVNVRAISSQNLMLKIAGVTVNSIVMPLPPNQVINIGHT
jgi:hypothetical protein